MLAIFLFNIFILLWILIFFIFEYLLLNKLKYYSIQHKNINLLNNITDIFIWGKNHISCFYLGVRILTTVSNIIVDNLRMVNSKVKIF